MCVCVFVFFMFTLHFFEGVKISVTDEEAAQESSGSIGKSFWKFLFVTVI